MNMTTASCGPTFRLSADGRELFLGSSPAPFLNGINVAWIRWDDAVQNGPRDPGAAVTYCGLEAAMRFVVENHGNALRVWLFTEPRTQLTWSADDGSVTGLADGVVLTARTVLELAEYYSVHVVLVLFNGALARDAESCSLYSGPVVMDSLVRNVIQPLATALRPYNSLAMYEVINEPEGLLDTSLSASGKATPAGDVTSPCVASSVRLGACTGDSDSAGWNALCRVPALQLQRFINHVVAALHEADARHLVTLGR